MIQVSVMNVGVIANTLNTVCSKFEIARCCISVTNTLCSFIAWYFVVAMSISRKTQSVPPARKDTWLSVSFHCAIL